MDPNNNNNEGIDLSGAFKNSGTGVTYEDNGWRAMRYYREPLAPRIVQWTMKYSGGLIKDEKQAQYVLLGFAVAAIAVSLYLFFGGSSGKSNTKTIIDFPELQRQNAR